MKKKIIIFVLTLFTMCGKGYAQDNLQLGIGPYMAWGMGTNISAVPDGRHNAIAFYRLPDVGFHFYMPITDSLYIGWALDMGLTNFGYQVENWRIEKMYPHHFGYITVNPQIVLRGLMIGPVIAIPAFADYIDRKIDRSHLSILSGMSLEYLYPVWGDEDGRINVFFKMLYMFSTTFDDYIKNDPLRREIPETDKPINNSHNPRFASLTFGFSYVFNLTKPPVIEEEN